MSSHGLKPGSILRHDTYRIERVLGQGGFGITYLAIDLSLERLVAIKEFFPKDYCDRDESTSHLTIGTGSNSELVSRLKAKFLKEARNIAKLDHPGIIKIHTAFEENNTAYYVMDYIEGENLNEMVKRRGPLPERQAIKYITQIGEALEYIHHHRMTHFDVKPANIMVRKSDDRAILIDFGLSKQYDTNEDTTIILAQSPGYTPIELLDESSVSVFSPKVDIYSLTATFYFLISGVRPPYLKNVDRTTILFPDDFPKKYKPFIYKGMNEDANKRFEEIKELLTYIEKLGSNKSQWRKRLYIFDCIFLAACIFLFLYKSRNINVEGNPESLVEIVDTCALRIFYPNYSNIDLICGTQPPQQDSNLIFVAEAAFNKENLTSFSHSNISGNHVSGGKWYDGSRDTFNTGAFIYYNGNPQFLYDNYSYGLNEAAQNRGCAFGQEMIIHKGIEIDHKRNLSEVNRFMSLCEINGRIAVVQALYPISFEDYISKLKSLEVDESIYLNRAKYNFAWYREDNGQIKYINSTTPSPYYTNWICFYQNGPINGAEDTYDFVTSSLANLAHKHYGNENYWVYIYEANPQIKNPDSIYSNTKVFIPALKTFEKGTPEKTNEVALIKQKEILVNN